MDSLTQFTLGAAVSVAVMGRRTAAWKAALWGGIAGTLPDLDVLVDHGDAVLNMVLHRAESHAFVYLALLSGPLAWLVSRLQDEPELVRRWWLAMALVLLTHPMLDLMTVYGTQVWHPFSDQAYGAGSIFIIDPAYTLPLLLGLGLAVSARAGGLCANQIALGISTAYLAWSLLAQALVTHQARQDLHATGLPSHTLLVTPTPFNTLLWRVVTMDGERYHEGFYSLLDRGRTIRLAAFPSGHALAQQHASHPQVRHIARFSDGFFRMSHAQGRLWLTDLRMGQEPGYVFHFDIGPPLDATHPVPPAATQINLRTDVPTALRWLWRRMWGEDIASPGHSPPATDHTLDPTTAPSPAPAARNQ
ncbi:MAG: metal-dependent hydrolase [Burkholderiales bacterium]|nr:metal-dependent hydrolase [Burkholderiales bacterium]